MPDSSVVSLIDRYRELLDIQEEIAAGAVTKAPEISPAVVNQRLAAGETLISFEDFFPGWEQAKQGYKRVAEWATGGAMDPQDSSVAAEHFRKLALMWYHGGTFSAQGDKQFSTKYIAMIGACVKPFLQVKSKQFMAELDQSKWQRGYCPVCGASPDFSYLSREEGARWLMCSRCDSEWLFQRLACPYCSTQDQIKLHYLTDDSERYRLYTCDVCRKYIKTIDMRRTQGYVRLPLERILTIDLDQQAISNGYRVPIEAELFGTLKKV